VEGTEVEDTSMLPILTHGLPVAYPREHDFDYGTVRNVVYKPVTIRSPAQAVFSVLEFVCLSFFSFGVEHMTEATEPKRKPRLSGVFVDRSAEIRTRDL